MCGHCENIDIGFHFFNRPHLIRLCILYLVYWKKKPIGPFTEMARDFKKVFTMRKNSTLLSLAQSDTNDQNKGQI